MLREATAVTRHRRFRKVFLRYFFSYVLVVLVPLTFLSVFTLRYLRRDLATYAIRETQLRFDKLVESIENEYDTILATSTQILNDLVVARAISGARYEDVASAKNMLGNYVVTNDFVEEIFVLDRRSAHILTSRTRVSFDFFFSQVYRLAELSAAQVWRSIMQISNSTNYPFGSVTGLVESAEGSGVFLTSGELMGADNPNLFVGFFLNSRRLEEIVSGGRDVATRYYLLSSQDTMLFHTDPHWKENYSQLLQLLDPSRTTGTVSIGGSDHFYVAERSRYTGLGYIGLVPRAVHLAELDRTVLVFVLSLAACVATATVVIILLTIYNYRPIRRLLDYAGPATGARPDELRAVEQAMLSMRKSNERLEAAVTSGRTAVAEHMVGLLLKDEARSGAELDRFLSEHGIRRDSGFQVLVLRPETTTVSSGISPSTMAALIREVMPDDLVVFSLESIVRKYFILLVVHPRGSEAPLNGALAQLQRRVSAEHDLQVTVGMGRMYHDCTATAKSYLEAVSCLDYSIMRGPGATISMDDIDPGKLEHQYPSALLAELQRLCERGEFTGVAVTLERIRSEIRTHNYPLHMVRMVAYDVLARVQGAFMRTTVQPVRRSELFARIESLVSVGSVDTFFDHVIALIVELDGREPVDGRAGEILDYVAEHAADRMLSATGVADHFGMERASFSRYFKRHNGATFVDFVSALRVENAKELLQTTNLPISEIVMRIGYSDASAFIKKFRKYTGTTPSAYRSDRRNVTA
jgi:AraC-like DNA-binding protein